MDELTLDTPAEEKKDKSTLRFALAAVISVLLSVAIMTVLAYYLLRTIALESQFDKISHTLQRDLQRQVNFGNFKAPDVDVTRRLLAVKRLHGVEEMAFFAPDGNLLWSSARDVKLSPPELKKFRSIVEGDLVSAVLVDSVAGSLQLLKALGTDQHTPIPALTPIFSRNDNLLALVNTRHDFSAVLQEAK